ILACDLALEHQAIPELRDAVAHCDQVRDYVSKELFEKILTDEEGHVDWLETQLSLIDNIGEQNYLQSQMKPAE
ncbi:MAG: ferritin-like domain-containing protein, partial [Pseudomonadota bacterium]